MRTLAGVVVMGLILAAAIAVTVIDRVVQAWPYLLAGWLALVIVRHVRRRPTAAGMPRNVPRRSLRTVTPPRGAWVWIPVWASAAAPPPPMDVIDADVIDGPWGAP